MRALALDPTTGDLLTSGGLSLVEGVAAVAQRLRGRLGLARGEWFADTSIGVPWVQTILGQRGSERIAETILRAAITSCPGVAALESFTLALNTTTRHASVTFRVRTVDGATLAVTAGPEGFAWEAV